LCDGNPQWLDDELDDISAQARWDSQEFDEGQVLCFMAKQKQKADRRVAVVTCKETDFQLKHLENVLQITKKKIKVATKQECVELFGFASESILPVGFPGEVDVFLSTTLRSSRGLKFLSGNHGTGYHCTWETLEKHYGSNRWIGPVQKNGELPSCRFWEAMDTDNLSYGTAEQWREISSDQVKVWLSQVRYNRKRVEVVLEEEPEPEEIVSSRYFTPADDTPSKLGRYGGATESLFNFLKWNVKWTTSRPNYAVAWYTARGHEVPYEYGLGPQLPELFPDWLEVLKEHMMVTVGLDKTYPPNGCNFNFYKDGSGALNPHSDNEDIFDGMNQPITIVSFSIGQDRTFHIDKNFRNTSKVKARKKLDSLSYLTMEGFFQKHLKHALFGEPERTDPRINMTWRWIVPQDKRRSRDVPMTIAKST
jgi:alkylated DNA repair dioxygenase AlkB/prolyl-tRNA editing enzyme YbaK/EbsC (Cys-tRNA(Pro) deacylase)